NVLLNTNSAASSGLSFNGAGPITISGSVVNGNASAAEGIAYAGTSLMSLNGSNTYTGATTLSSGGLNFNNAAAIGTGAFVLGGGSLDNTSGAAITNSKNNALSITGDFNFLGTNNLNLG